MIYKQQSNQGCLVVSLLRIFDIEPSYEVEKSVLPDGLFRLRDNYTLGCILAFLDLFPEKRLKLYVDNKYYLEVLKNWTSDKRIEMVFGGNRPELLGLLKPPFVVYIDNNIVDGWTHLPHFITVVGSTEIFYRVLDPWTGEIKKTSKQKNPKIYRLSSFAYQGLSIHHNC